MSANGRTALAIALLLGLASSAAGRSWRVEQNGSGDFTVIQAAVDAAAPGDTIRVGPGWFAQNQPFTLPGWTPVPVFVAVTKDDLVLEGSGPGVTIVGATWPWSPPVVTFGIVQYDAPHLTVTGMTIANASAGLYCYLGRLDLRGCTISGCGTGLHDYSDRGLSVADCTFGRCVGDGTSLLTLGPARDIVVSNCVFASDVNIADGSTNALIRDCEFLVDTALGVTGDSDAALESNRLDRPFGVYVGTGCRASLTGNVIGAGSAYSLRVDATATVTGSSNVFAGGSPTIRVDGGSLTLHGNHILNTGSHSVALSQFFGPSDGQLDLTGNYWGTTDSTTIAGWILDGHDDPSIRAFVQFAPFSGQPLPSETKSWGQVKTLYSH